MKLHQFQALTAAAQELSFSRVPSSCMLSNLQSVEKSGNLEAQLRLTLLKKSANGIALTDPGYRFPSDVEQILRLCSRTAEAAQRSNERD
jgi:DNA-binding transcriptional LysR family regulator